MSAPMSRAEFALDSIYDAMDWLGMLRHSLSNREYRTAETELERALSAMLKACAELECE